MLIFMRYLNTTTICNLDYLKQSKRAALNRKKTYFETAPPFEVIRKAGRGCFSDDVMILFDGLANFCAKKTTRGYKNGFGKIY